MSMTFHAITDKINHFSLKNNGISVLKGRKPAAKSTAIDPIVITSMLWVPAVAAARVDIKDLTEWTLQRYRVVICRVFVFS